MTSLTGVIVGSGLVLARVLEIRGIQSTIYELDVSTDARNQSGILHLHKVSGRLPRARSASTSSSGAWSEVRPLLLPHALKGGQILD